MTKHDDGVLVSIRGGSVRVSREDAQSVKARAWSLTANGYVRAAGANARGTPSLMHRILLGAKTGEEVHHVNGDRQDNRRSNLELTTASAHQREHHSHAVIERNLASRKYPKRGVCGECGATFVKHPDHRGRQRLCSKMCSTKKAVRVRLERARRAAGEEG